jgi:hypothetical protein
MSLSGASGLHYAETAEKISRDLALDGAAYSAPTRIDMVTAIWSLRASTAASTGMAPPSGGTDLISHLQQTLSPGMVRGLFVPALAEL